MILLKIWLSGVVILTCGLAVVINLWADELHSSFTGHGLTREQAVAGALILLTVTLGLIAVWPLVAGLAVYLTIHTYRKHGRRV